MPGDSDSPTSPEGQQYDRLNQGTMTTRQVADLLQLSISTVHQLAEAGDLPGRRIGREWRFLRADLLALFPPPPLS